MFVTPINGPISPLYLACIGGKIAIVIHLLQAGANPNRMCGNECDTALIQAATYGYVDIIMHLLNKKKRLGATNHNIKNIKILMRQ